MRLLIFPLFEDWKEDCAEEFSRLLSKGLGLFCVVGGVKVFSWRSSGNRTRRVSPGLYPLGTVTNSLSLLPGGFKISFMPGRALGGMRMVRKPRSCAMY